MQKTRIINTLLAGTVLLSTVGCSSESINAIAKGAGTAIATAIKAFNETLTNGDGNQAEVDLATVDELGNSTTVSSEQVEDVMVDGKRVNFAFNASGKMTIKNFPLNQANAEAQVRLKGYDRPVIVLLHPGEGQSRGQIKVSAKISIANQGSRKVLLSQRAIDYVPALSEADMLKAQMKESIKLALGSAAANKLKGKKIVSAWLDGDKIPQAQLWIDPMGHILVHNNVFLRYFMGLDGKGEVLRNDDKITTVSFRESAAYKAKKTALRNKVLRNKEKYVVRKVVTEQKVVTIHKITTTELVSSGFGVKQFFGNTSDPNAGPTSGGPTSGPAPQPIGFQPPPPPPGGVGININVNVRINLDQQTRMLNQQQQQRLEQLRQEQIHQGQINAELRKQIEQLRKPVAKLREIAPGFRETVKIGTQTVDRRVIAPIRGLGATKLARQGVYKARTLYVLTKDMRTGRMQLFRFTLNGQHLKTAADTLKGRLTRAKQKAEMARNRIRDFNGDAAAGEALLQQAAADADITANLTVEGEVTVEATTENTNTTDSTALAEDCATAEQAEQVVVANEMSSEIDAELEQELATVVEPTETSTQSEDAEVVITAADVQETVPEQTVTTEVVTEDQVNLSTEVQEATTETTQATAEADAVLAEELLVNQVATGS